MYVINNLHYNSRSAPGKFIFFLQIFEYLLRKKKKCSCVHCHTVPTDLVIINNFMFLEIFQVSGSDKTQFWE